MQQLLLFLPGNIFNGDLRMMVSTPYKCFTFSYLYSMIGAIMETRKTMQTFSVLFPDGM